MIKTLEQELKEVEQWENFLKSFEGKKELSKEDIKQLQLFNYKSTTIYFQIFEEGYKENKAQERFFKLQEDIKRFYNSQIKKYDLPKIRELFGIETEHTMTTGVITFEGIAKRKAESCTLTTYHKNDFIHN